MNSDKTTLKLPVIDLSEKSLKPGTSSWKSGCEQVTRALEVYGCFVATHDDLTSELHDRAFESAAELFDLPLETKLLNENDKPFHGYHGQVPDFPIYESLGIVNPQILSQARTFSNLMWPQGNDKFCESINAYSKLVTKLEVLVESMIYEGYGVKQYLDSNIASIYYVSRFVKYTVPKEGENNVGAFPHTDKGFITILHSNDVKGLEVKTRDGQWIQLDPFHSSFVVMAGEASMAWSNGRIYSAIHKVLMTGERSRYTIAMFAMKKGTIHVPEELIDEEKHPRQYKSFDHVGMVEYFTTTKGMEENTIKAYCGI